MTLAVLSPSELEVVTGKRQKAAQRRALGNMGIRFKPRPDGTPFVLKEWLEERERRDTDRPVEPDWSNVA